MKTLKTILAVIVTIVVLSSCSKEEDAPMPVGPEISYPETTYNTTFRETGNTDLPTLKWNGEVGSISLASNIPGVEVNASNGVVSWNEALPLGTSEIKVVATNSIGQKTVTVQIMNEFAGEFEGGANSDPNSTILSVTGMKFNYLADGTMKFSYSSITGSGTWSRDGNTITTHFSYDGSPIAISMVGELTNNEAAATLKGFHYPGYDTTPGTESGYFRMHIGGLIAI